MEARIDAKNLYAAVASEKHGVIGDSWGVSAALSNLYIQKRRQVDGRKTEDWRRCEQDGASPSQGTRRILMELIKGDIHEQIQ